jgi:hypothetical protein
VSIVFDNSFELQSITPSDEAFTVHCRFDWPLLMRNPAKQQRSVAPRPNESGSTDLGIVGPNYRLSLRFLLLVHQLHLFYRLNVGENSSEVYKNVTS